MRDEQFHFTLCSGHLQLATEADDKTMLQPGVNKEQSSQGKPPQGSGHETKTWMDGWQLGQALDLV